MSLLAAAFFDNVSNTNWELIAAGVTSGLASVTSARFFRKNPSKAAGPVISITGGVASTCLIIWVAKSPDDILMPILGVSIVGLGAYLASELKKPIKTNPETPDDL
ncbi:hypothetical protein GCM10027519_47540 [Kineococcus endophyticus]